MEVEKVLTKLRRFGFRVTRTATWIAVELKKGNRENASGISHN